MTLADRIQALLARSPGLADREIADQVLEPGSPPQQVNGECRHLANRGILIRRKREDGLLGNYLSQGEPLRENRNGDGAPRIKVADEVWIATALLHREHPERQAFAVAEIVDRASTERMTRSLRPGVQIHAYSHCVANRRPNPANYRMLYATADGRRRLFREGDDFHPHRAGGKTTPRREDIGDAYAPLLDWYERDYSSTGPGQCVADEPQRDGEPSSSLWDDLDELWSQIPPEERRNLPADGSEQLDHYLYGWPRKTR